jgi:hypothetical protein
MGPIHNPIWSTSGMRVTLSYLANHYTTATVIIEKYKIYSVHYQNTFVAEWLKSLTSYHKPNNTDVSQRPDTHQFMVIDKEKQSFHSSAQMICLTVVEYIPQSAVK